METERISGTVSMGIKTVSQRISGWGTKQHYSRSGQPSSAYIHVGKTKKHDAAPAVEDTKLRSLFRIA